MRPFFVLLLIVSTILILISCGTDVYQVFFRGDSIKENTLRFIRESTQSLDICVYSITDEDIISALAQRARAGVRIRICTDDSYRFAPIDTIKVVYDREGLMHNKYMIADSKTVWFGSTNLTPTSLEKHENNVIITHAPKLVDSFQKHFSQCFAGSFKGQRTPINNQNLKFSPEDDCFDHIMNELSRAKKSIYIAMYAFSDNRIAHYLKVLSSKGLKICVLADKDWNASSIYSDTTEMARYSHVRFDICDGLLHEKFILIDEKTLITGSYNYTASAQTRNDEFIFKTSNKDLVERFRDHFLDLWEASDPIHLRDE